MTDNVSATLDEFYEYLDTENPFAIGYPSSKDVHVPALLRFLEFPLNNIGDPYTDATYHLETRRFEREVVEFFADAVRAPSNDRWGYITNGGTEANLYSLYLAREKYPDGIVYFSEHTHYSVKKSLHILGIPHMMIRAQAHGEIDYDDLREAVRARLDAPPIVFANVGTTMTEARDDLRRLVTILDSLVVKKRYIHSDAALCGAYAPFLEPRPHFDFVDGADSVSISGHKFLGSALPCGIVVARMSNVRRIAQSVDYIGTLDTTISGSRNGFTPLVLWHRIKSLGVAGLRERTSAALDVARYAEDRLRDIGVDAWRNPNAITVVFPELPTAITKRWQLATRDGISHLIAMPGITRGHIDRFVQDIRRSCGSRRSSPTCA